MPTWETATDWDNRQSESGVVHESVTNTDHNDDTIVKQGYSAASPLFQSDLKAYYPLHEDSGSTANDFSGNGNDGSITSGVTLGATGLLGTTAYNFAGGSGIDNGSIFDNNVMAASFWFNLDNIDTSSSGERMWDQQNLWNMAFDTQGNDKLMVQTYGNNTGGIGPALSAGTWYFAAQLWDVPNDTLKVWLANLGSDTSVSVIYDNTSYTDAADSFTDSSRVGSNSAGDLDLDGRLWDFRFYEGRVLSDSDVQQLYDIVRTNGTLTSNKKQL